MEMTQIFEEAKQAIGSNGVFGAPYEKNGVTVIPAARVMGGVGGGEGRVPTPAEEGSEPSNRPTGTGGGFGVSGHPIGAFVIAGEKVRWMPAVDVNRLILGFQVVMVVFFLAIRSIARMRTAEEDS